MKMTYVTYICKQCGEQDTDKFFANENPHIAINCAKCHAGQGLTVEQMLTSGKGAFPEKSRRASG